MNSIVYLLKKGTLIPVILFLISGVLLGLLILTFSDLHYLLRNLAHLSDVVIAVLALVALYGYLYQREKDTTDSIMKLLETTRDKLIPIKFDLMEEMHGVHGSFTLPSTRIDVFDVDQFRIKYSKIALEQSKVFFTKNTTFIGNLNTLCNLVEEFAVRAMSQGAETRQEMEAVIPIYVRLVEEFAMYFFMEGMRPGNGNYQPVFELYRKWRDSPCVQRTTSVDNFHKVLSEIFATETATLELPAAAPHSQKNAGVKM